MATGKAETVASISCTRRIKLDIKEIVKNPIEGVLIESDEQDFMKAHVIINGPEGTPYEKGFFYFIVTFPTDYPWSPPDVKLMTTGSGTVRFNPNLYSSGKVCLSILGTWQGPGWTPMMSLSTVLVSVQSLLNENPYCNEPGHSKEKRSGDAEKYKSMVRHDTIKVAVLGMVKNSSSLNMPKSFKVHIENSFLQNYEFYEKVVVGNIHLSGMVIKDPLYNYEKGTYQYAQLLDSLEDVRAVLLSQQAQ